MKCLLLAPLLVGAALLRAQDTGTATYIADGNVTEYRLQGDYRELQLFGGFRFVAPHLGITLRGTNALLLSDAVAAQQAMQQHHGDGLPTRGLPDLPSRKLLSPAELHSRIERSLRAMGQANRLPSGARLDDKLAQLRLIYMEGGISIQQGNIEVARCERLWLSPADDRIVMEQAELRYLTPGSQMLLVRGPQLVKQGNRWTGSDVTVTTCTAGKPHAALGVGEVEIIERDGQFEVRLHDQRLQVGGVDLLPLPDARIFTGEQTQFPIRRARVGYSGKEGARVEFVVGMPWNESGGRLHHWLTGREASEFRGDWELGVGWRETRGVPLEGALDYRGGELYRGRTEAFWLQDRGEDLREIRTELDGSAIDAEQRALLRSENRLQLGPGTYATLEAFAGSDPAAYSEFWGGEYRTHETPESALYLHHSADNWLVTVGTRFSTTDFSYRDSRALADRFIEELPVASFHWFAQPIATLPWGSSLLFDMRTEVGQRRSAYDSHSPEWTPGDRTLRADQLLELSAPMHWGPISVRPYVSGRGTYYDQTSLDDDKARFAAEVGVSVGTRLSRTTAWFGDDQLRHVIAPRLLLADRFFVNQDEQLFADFDELDQLKRENLLRAEVRNLFQRIGNKGDGNDDPNELLFADLAQDFWPDAGRDHGGETLGLLYYDLQLRPDAKAWGLHTCRVGLYGDHDWQQGMRTLDAELRVGPIAGLDWTASYRADTSVAGAVGLFAHARMLSRWETFAGSQYDLDRDEWLNYQIGLRRNDHDWSLQVVASHNPYSDETTLRFEFLPSFGGMGKNRPRYLRGNDAEWAEADWRP